MDANTELNYLIDALKVLRTELATARDKAEVMVRIDSIKDCIVRIVEQNTAA
jgi:hypothetical protein